MSDDSSPHVKTHGAKCGVEVADGMRRRVAAAATLRQKDRLEMMTRRRKEHSDDDDDSGANNNFSSGGGNNNNNRQHQNSAGGGGGGTMGRGTHRFHEQPPSPEELYAHIGDYIAMVSRVNDADTVRLGVTRIRQLMCLEFPSPLQEFCGRGGIEALVSLLGSQDSSVQFDAVWSLTNIATGSPADIDNVLAGGVVRNIVPMLQHPEERIRNQCAWCLGNLVGCGYRERDHVIANDAMPATLAAINGGACDANGGQPQFENENIGTVRSLTWLVAQMCRFKPKPAMADVGMCLPTVRRLLEHADAKVREDAAWAVSYISDGNFSVRGRAVIEAGVIPPLLAVFADGRESSMLPCLRTFGNFCAEEESTNLVFEWGVPGQLLRFLESTMPRDLRKEACWILSNVLCGTPDQIRVVLDAGLVPPLVNNLGAPEFEVRKEATWGVANLALKAPLDVIRFLVETCGAIDALAHVMAAEEERACVLALEAIGPILAAGKHLREANGGVNPYARRFEERGGAETLKNLVMHTSNTIAVNAAELLDKYFGWQEQPNDADGYCDYSEDDNDGGGGGSGDDDDNAYEPQPGPPAGAPIRQFGPHRDVRGDPGRGGPPNRHHGNYNL